MKYAAIDIGTNTVLCLIAEVTSGQVSVLEDLALIARLGEGLSHQGQLKPEARERTLVILEKYQKAIARHGVAPQCTRVIATAGLRKAANAQDFLDEVKQKLGFSIEIIDGDREAQLNHVAVHRGLNLPPATPLLIMDIGGGSTEIITTDASGITGAKSLALGSVWLTERHFKLEDPPSQRAYHNAEVEIQTLLGQAGFCWPKPATMIGIAGTITTLSAMHQQMTIYDPQKVHGSQLSRNAILKIEKTLLQIPLAEKIKLPGLQKERADVLLAGAMIARIVMQLAQVDALTVSDQGIRYGVLWEYA